MQGAWRLFKVLVNWAVRLPDKSKVKLPLRMPLTNLIRLTANRQACIIRRRPMLLRHRIWLKNKEYLIRMLELPISKSFTIKDYNSKIFKINWLKVLRLPIHNLELLKMSYLQVKKKLKLVMLRRRNGQINIL